MSLLIQTAKDFAIFFLAALLALFVSDAWSALTKEDARTQRHANEQKYLNCIQACMGTGNSVDRIWGKQK